MTRLIQPGLLGKLIGLLSPKDRGRALSLLALMIVGMAFETLGIGLVLPVLQLLAQPEALTTSKLLRPVYEFVGRPEPREMVLAGVAGLVAVYFCKSVFLGFLYWIQMRFAFRLQADVSERLFDTYLRQPYTFHLQRNSAELMRNIVIEVAQLIANCVLPALILATETLVLVGLFVLLFAIEPVGAMAAMLVIGAAGWVFHRVTGRYLVHWGQVRQGHEALRLQRIQEGLAGAKDVILSGREGEFIRQYRIHNDGAADVTEKQKTLQKLPQLWFELLAISGMATLIVVMLGRGVAMADMLSTVGLFAAASFRMLPSANRIASAVQSLRYGMPVIDVVSAELQLPVISADGKAGTPLPFERQVEFDRVSYRYPAGERLAIEDLSLEIRCGETIGLIGASGAGKSTVVDLFLGLIQPQSGTIRVDGVDIASRLRDWQVRIGYVPQSIFLSDDSVRRNVGFGLADADIDDTLVWHALRLAQLAEFVEFLPDRLETRLGERGVRLSGGQRQRIGIARALYHNPSVLVLDEATSALDTETEREVMEAVWALQGRKTILIVAHRLSTLARCNHIYRLGEDGMGMAEKVDTLARPQSGTLDQLTYEPSP